jgi:preprotein translocase subunit SecA
LKNYLSADEVRKHRYYEAVEGASAACHPGITNPTVEDAHLAEATAEAALKVVKRRDQRASGSHDTLATLITDAYATVAIAYRRAAGVYAIDEEMQQLGTAAVHLLTMATSYMTAHPDGKPK